jgi:hypothetical protein
MEQWVSVDKAQTTKVEPVAASPASAAAVTQSKNDDKEKQPSVSSAFNVVPSAMKFSKSFFRDHLLSTGKHSLVSKGNGKGKFTIVTAPVMSGGDVKTNGSGAVAGLYGWSTLSAAAEMVLWIQLYDICRVKAIHLQYAGRAIGTTIASLIHQPMIWIYRPEDLAANTYAQAVLEVNALDKRCALVNTSDYSRRHSFDCPRASLPITAGTSSASPTIGNWVNGTVGTVGGGVQVSVRDDTINVNTVLGVLCVTYELEFAYVQL